MLKPSEKKRSCQDQTNTWASNLFPSSDLLVHAHDEDMALSLRRRSLTRLLFLFAVIFFLRLFFFSSSSSSTASPSLRIQNAHEIKEHNFFERATRPDKSLNVQKYKFLQSRMGRDDREDLFSDLVRNGARDYWERFQLPYITGRETAHTDAQTVVSAIDQLLSLNGWVAGLCPTLARPFGQNQHHGAYDDLVKENHLYYVAIVIHSADHFLVDQLAVIVQMVKRLGTQNVFVSMLDYDSTDSTETLTDLCEAVLTLLGVPYRIRRVPSMTADPVAAYYPSEEAHMKNLALEPLFELYHRRSLKFDRVIWLKGFTCPNDILETIKVSFINDAAMVCGMDWAEHNGFFIFSDRWRTRDIDGDQFRQSKSSSSKADTVPPRDKVGASRYAQYLPFQVFCCESGTHVVDPEQSYYKGITYRSGWETGDVHNVTNGGSLPARDPDSACLDSSQAWFCRDLWVHTAGEGMNEMDHGIADSERLKKRQEKVAAAQAEEKKNEQPPDDAKKVPGPAAGPEGVVDEGVRAPQSDEDANAGSDFDAMPDSEDVPMNDVTPLKLTIPNGAYRPARILVNPRCVTTYAGVSHTQLALDLFGPQREEEEKTAEAGDYVLEDWEGAPESFVCQEQRQTGGRKATKTQRRLGFSIHDELHRVYSS
ncbi:Cryptococcal mannosyltransferase 1 [Pleurotus pulmonarius]|nr:Cryptococcal mannosyltransferase 1 [Pleurotus pulmonarius]